MKAIYNGIIVTETEELKNHAIVFDKKIVDICPVANLPEGTERIDAGGGYVMPGLIDLHIHGGLLHEVSFCDLKALKEISQNIAKNGVTAWCPTTLTLSKETLQKAFNVIGEAKRLSCSGLWQGAEVLGVNSEGPFINPAKKGAQTECHIIPPDPQFIIDNKDVVRIVTVAPEMDKDFSFIKKVREQTDVVVSLGHTDADFETAKAAYKAGANHTTHLFNAMSPLNHRNPGVVGAALGADSAYCELIADTVHVNAGLFETVARLKGEKLILITDNIAPAGLPEGEYMSGEESVFIKNGCCRMRDGTLAGSIYPFCEAIRNFRKHTSLPLCEIVKAASLNPARLLGEDKYRGSLAVGKKADIIITDKDFNVKTTAICGEVWYNS